MPFRASDRKDSTPRHGRLLHPSSWAARDDRDRAAEHFFQGGSPKQATPFLRQDLLTARNRSDQISGDGAWMNFRFSRALPPPPGGLSLTPGREAFHPMDAARLDHLFA